MAIFNSVFESVSADTLDAELEKADIETSDDNIKGEADEADNIVAEFCRDVYMLEASMYVADVQLETAVFEGASIESVMENFLTDALKKAKEKVLELWAKLKDWFNKMKSKFKAFTAASASFVKKHSSEILKNFDKHPDWKFSGYTYNDAAYAAADQVIDNIKASARKKGSTDGSLDIDAAMADVGQKFKSYTSDAGMIPAGTYDDIETGSVSALGTVIMGACRGGEATDSHPQKGVVEHWIKTCREAEKTLKAIYDHEAKAKKDIAKIIDELKKAEKDAKSVEKKSSSDDNTKSSNIHNTIKFNTKLASIISKVSTTIVNARTEQFKAFSRRLKEIYTLKGDDTKKDKDKDESKGSEAPTSESFNLLNNAFGMF